MLLKMFIIGFETEKKKKPFAFGPKVLSSLPFPSLLASAQAAPCLSPSLLHAAAQTRAIGPAQQRAPRLLSPLSVWMTNGPHFFFH